MINDGVSLVKIQRDALVNDDYMKWSKNLLNNVSWLNEGSRKVSYHGRHPYKYNGGNHQPKTDLAFLDDVLNFVNKKYKQRFNSILLNQYKTGKNKLGWHSDDEAELGRDPTIASLSFGSARAMWFKNKQTGVNVKCELRGGDFLIMSKATQHHWLHSISASESMDSRISLTFREIKVAV